MTYKLRIGAGGSWPVFDERQDPTVVKQQTNVSCGPACAQMLFADRGVKITQKRIEEASFVPIDAIDLASALNKLEPSQTRLWLGGTLVIPGSDEELIRQLNQTGSWAAVLWERSASMGHLVVVNGLNDKGRIIIRDPWDGTMYTMEIKDFLSVWLRTGIYSKRKRA